MLDKKMDKIKFKLKKCLIYKEPSVSFKDYFGILTGMSIIVIFQLFLLARESIWSEQQTKNDSEKMHVGLQNQQTR